MKQVAIDQRKKPVGKSGSPDYRFSQFEVSKIKYILRKDLGCQIENTSTMFFFSPNHTNTYSSY